MAALTMNVASSNCRRQLSTFGLELHGGKAVAFSEKRCHLRKRPEVQAAAFEQA